MDFKKELENLINRYSVENAGNTPDFILAGYIERCLHAFAEATQQRETWYGSGRKAKTDSKKTTM